MKCGRLAAASLAVCVLFLPLAWGVEHAYNAGKILGIEQKAHSRVLYYLVNTPVTADEPYYEVTIEISGMIYVTEYVPAHAHQTLPGDWQVNGVVRARVEKRDLFVEQSGKPEFRLAIVKRTAAAAMAIDARPATLKP